MYAILTSAFGWLFNLIFRASVVKFVMGTAVFWVLAMLTDKALAMLAGFTGSGVQSAFDGLANDTLYFLGVLRLDVGIPMILAAYVVRFAIRRLPFIG